MNRKTKMTSMLIIISTFICLAAFSPVGDHLEISLQQDDGSDPPAQVVKLIFVHHSTGENWLNDDFGDLGRALGENNYFVSDTNYGWGPNSIGDRTDIPDWLEWFSSGSTTETMEALYHENGQHSSYTRSQPDPGGENQIILFKSCFPNSDLEGKPGDLPNEEGWLSVGHAKYVYNEILKYFQNHPEKLFVVITAPPLSHSDNAANARAFNQWLVQDWLLENDYPYQNVAVFDFYNLLTGSDGHHSYENGQEIHQVASQNTLHYPSGDDHPSRKGSQKATVEFIPLLNYFYNRWQSDAPFPPAAQGNDEIGGETASDQSTALSADLSGWIDQFEGDGPQGTSGWEAYWDEGTSSSLSCVNDTGQGFSGNSLRLDYQISPYGWGTCGLSYDQAQDWQDRRGMVFYIHSGQTDQTLNVDLYVDGPQGKQSYLYELELTPEITQDWMQIDIPWERFRRVEWEADAGSEFTKPDQISGLAFGFSTEDVQLEGTVWIDDLGWIGGPGFPAENESEPTQGESENIQEPDQNGGRGPCFPLGALPLGGAGLILYRRKKTT